jgi:hypothetical protein
MDAFLSHSRKDEGIVNSVFKLCKRAKIEPHIAEFEEIQSGKLGAKEIRDMIEKSEFFLLFLSENVVNEKDREKTIYTQNWVNFELGRAYAQKKEKKKFIYVLEPFNQIRFPIPYLDYYFLLDPDSEPHWEYLEDLISDDVSFEKYTKSWNPFTQMLLAVFLLTERLKGHPFHRPSDRQGHSMHCKECGFSYILLSKPREWLCPRCRKISNWIP